MKKTLIIVLAASLMLGGCGTMSNTGKGTLIGAGGGAILGAGIGAIAGDSKGAAIGAAVGAAVGAGTGAIIGNKMDKQKAELERIEGASVDTLSDMNGLKALKVTFAEGILFETGKSDLSMGSRTALDKFAKSLLDNPDTDLVIYGHTDNTGSKEVNQRISDQRAMSVRNYLVNKGVGASRLTTKGMAYDQPVADNSTAAGRAQNRRVEVYISANQEMIKKAENASN
ncbi:MAG: OmpA family protein [Bacteroidales bacterium]|nr:OmpA family protein [Bacteroidales bacterium]MDD4657406.1 OmpA family protein [Bacteroidales bacterium]